MKYIYMMILSSPLFASQSLWNSSDFNKKVQLIEYNFFEGNEKSIEEDLKTFRSIYTNVLNYFYTNFNSTIPDIDFSLIEKNMFVENKNLPVNFKNTLLCLKVIENNKAKNIFSKEQKNLFLKIIFEDFLSKNEIDKEKLVIFKKVLETIGCSESEIDKLYTRYGFCDQIEKYCEEGNIAMLMGKFSPSSYNQDFLLEMGKQIDKFLKKADKNFYNDKIQKNVYEKRISEMKNWTVFEKENNQNEIIYYCMIKAFHSLCKQIVDQNLKVKLFNIFIDYNKKNENLSLFLEDFIKNTPSEKVTTEYLIEKLIQRESVAIDNLIEILKRVKGFKINSEILISLYTVLFPKIKDDSQKNEILNFMINITDNTENFQFIFDDMEEMGSLAKTVLKKKDPLQKTSLNKKPFTPKHSNFLPLKELKKNNEDHFENWIAVYGKIKSMQEDKEIKEFLDYMILYFEDQNFNNIDETEIYNHLLLQMKKVETKTAKISSYIELVEESLQIRANILNKSSRSLMIDKNKNENTNIINKKENIEIKNDQNDFDHFASF